MDHRVLQRSATPLRCHRDLSKRVARGTRGYSFSPFSRVRQATPTATRPKAAARDRCPSQQASRNRGRLFRYNDKGLDRGPCLGFHPLREGAVWSRGKNLASLLRRSHEGHWSLQTLGVYGHGRVRHSLAVGIGSDDRTPPGASPRSVGSVAQPSWRRPGPGLSRRSG